MYWKSNIHSFVLISCHRDTYLPISSIKSELSIKSYQNAGVTTKFSILLQTVKHTTSKKIPEKWSKKEQLKRTLFMPCTVLCFFTKDGRTLLYRRSKLLLQQGGIGLDTFTLQTFVNM